MTKFPFSGDVLLALIDSEYKLKIKIVCSLASFFASQIILSNLIHEFVWCFVDNFGLFDFDFRS